MEGKSGSSERQYFRQEGLWFSMNAVLYVLAFLTNRMKPPAAGTFPEGEGA